MPDPALEAWAWETARRLFYDGRPIFPGGLHSSERFWSDNEPWLASHGYLLRPRHRWGWTPSWNARTSEGLEDAEGGLENRVSLIMPMFFVC